MNLHNSKMFTLHLQLVDLALFNLFYPFSRTILERSESPAHSSYNPIIEPPRRYPVVKAVIVPKSEWAVVTLINPIYSLTAGSSFYSVLSFASPRGRGQGEGELFGRLQRLKNQKAKIKNVHRALDYRPLSEIIGFQNSAGAARTGLSASTCTKFTNLHKFTQSLSSYVQHLNLSTPINYRSQVH
jgi:hypothetical protein